MFCGIAFTSGYIIYFQFLGGKAEHLFFGITPEGIGFVGMFINFAVTFIVSASTPRPPTDVQEMVENIHIPTGANETKQNDFEI